MLISFVIPAYNRELTISRALRSIVDHGSIRDGYEVIVVDDASTDGTVARVKEWQQGNPQIILLEFQDHLERVAATNAGIRAASGDWIVRLDSDDELMSNFKAVFEKALDAHPRARLFNWGSVVQYPDRTVVREPFRPGLDANGQTRIFKSGQIFSGGFAFEKKLMWTAGFLPEKGDCYTFGQTFLNKHEELKPLYTQPDGSLKTDLGNPWGDDFALFYALTRCANPVTLDRILHITHVRP